MDNDPECFSKGPWEFVFKKGMMMPSAPLEELERRFCSQDNLGLSSAPHIVFNKNLAMLRHKVSGFCYYITAKEAMRYINFEHRKKHFHDYLGKPTTMDSGSINHIPGELKVKAAKDWQGKMKEEGSKIEQIEVTSDWTYTTPYKVDFDNRGKCDDLHSSARKFRASFELGGSRVSLKPVPAQSY